MTETACYKMPDHIHKHKALRHGLHFGLPLQHLGHRPQTIGISSVVKLALCLKMASPGDDSGLLSNPKRCSQDEPRSVAPVVPGRYHHRGRRTQRGPGGAVRAAQEARWGVARFGCGPRFDSPSEFMNFKLFGMLVFSLCIRVTCYLCAIGKTCIAKGRRLGLRLG